MTTTPDLGIPLVASQQAQPEVTHNEAIIILQTLSKGVLSIGDTAPPGSPDEGDAYIVGTAATGAWNGWDDHIATWYSGAWLFLPGYDSDGSQIAIGADQAGLEVFVVDEASRWRWSGSAWEEVASGALILRGTWDASSGSFPGGGAAQAGDVYIVSVGGTVDSVTFAVGDRIVAITDNASTTTFTGNWFKEDYTDQVLSVAGKTGAVTLDFSDFSMTAQYRLVGRSSSGAGAAQEISSSADVFTVLGSADVAAMRTNLGLATVAATGASTDLTDSANIPRLDAGLNTYSGIQRIQNTSGGTSQLDIWNDSANASFMLEGTTQCNFGIVVFRNDNSPATVSIRKARGTRSAPLVINSGDTLMIWQVQAYDGVAMRSASRFSSQVIATTPGPGDMKSLFQIGITKGGSGSPTANFFQIHPDSGLSLDGVNFLTAAGNTRMRVYTVATLPTAGTAGRAAFVSDATATTFASVVAGGGANGVPVYDDGTNWRVG